MYTAKARKKFKSCSPEKTCLLIDNILSSIGLKTTCFFTNIRSDAPSLRLNIANDEFQDFAIGTNGKGMTEKFARASAYGEFMERLQNGLISSRLNVLSPRETHHLKLHYPNFYRDLDTQRLLPSFQFAPDEVLYEKDDVENLINSYISESTRRILDWPYDNCYAVPFWRYGRNTVENLPYEIIRALTGTNGMCAGNTPAEALVQGMNEIIERYVLTRLISEKITPPDIPECFFEGHDVLYHLQNIKEQLGCELHIKDCSLAEGWPVIGILLIDRINRKYYFHIGADISCVTALERCLSETFQGSNDIIFKPIDIESEIRLRKNEDACHAELVMNCTNDSGRLPCSLYAQHSSYSFSLQAWEMYDGDDEQDIHRLFEQIHQRGFNIYIRDVSYLGFPAYHIYVPEMSGINITQELLSFLVSPRFPRFLKAHHPPTNKAALQQMSQDVERLVYAPRTYTLANSKDLWQSGNVRLLQGILYLRTDEWQKAGKLFSAFAAEEANPFQSLLYRFAADISIIQQQAPEMQSLLDDTYTEAFAHIARQKLLYTRLEEIFDIAPCFDCENCKLKSECKLISLLTLNKKLEQRYAKHLPIQSRISSIFSRT